MTAVTYTASRGLIAGHTQGEQYTLNINASRYLPFDDDDGHQLITESDIQTVITGSYTIHRFTTIPMKQAAMLAVREFLLSANTGSAILLDINGTAETPDNPTNAILKFKKSIKPSQPAHGFFVFDFEIIEQS